MPLSFTGARQHPRVTIGRAEVIPVTLASVLNRDHGHVTVLSAGGLQADVDRPCAFSIGGTVELRFTLPGFSDPLVCSGIVRDIVPIRGVGIEFNRISSSDRHSITHAVERWRATGVVAQIAPRLEVALKPQNG